MSFRTGFSALGASSLLLIALPVAGLTFQTVGHLPGGNDWTLVQAVSADGTTVVGSSFVGGGEEAFTWRAGVMTALGDLPGGNYKSRAEDVSADGSVVVGWGGAAGRWEAVVWDAGGMTSLGSDSADSASAAKAVSGDGTVVFGTVTPDGGGDITFRHEAGTFTRLGFLGDPPGRSNPFDVTPDGSVVVGQSISSSSGSWQAYRWEAGTMTALFEPADSSYEAARAVSADGRVIVGLTKPPGAIEEAAVWEDGVYTSLGQLPGGVAFSYAAAVSADGSLVVGNANSARGPDVFLWTRDAGMSSLLDALELSGVDLSAWTSFAATDVSADGNVIVGYGDRDGIQEGWVVHLVPEPGTALLFGLGLVALAASRRSTAPG